MEIQYSEEEREIYQRLMNRIKNDPTLLEEEKLQHIEGIPERILFTRSDREKANFLKGLEARNFDPPTSNGIKIKKLKENHMSQVKKKNKKLGEKYKEDMPPHFDLDVTAPEYVLNLLSDNPDRHLVQEVVGDLGEDNFVPQRKAFPIVAKLNVARLKSAAMQWSQCAMSLGIATDKTVNLPGGVVGVHYLTYLTIYADLLAACKGELTFFESFHPEYANLRASLGPRTVDSFAYSFDIDSIPDITQQLAAGIGFNDPTVQYSCSLAWPIGLDQAGREVLTNTIPTITVGDLMDEGIEETQSLWTEMVRYNKKSANLQEISKVTGFEVTAAAFAQTSSFPSPSYQPFCRLSSEVKIPGWALYISCLDFVDGSERRGNFIYNETRGPGTLAYRILYSRFGQHHFRIVPKQIPIEYAITAIVASIIQADIISDDLPTSGIVTQALTSFVSSISSGELLEYVMAAVCKRFAIASAIMAGVLPMNPGMTILGAGRQYYVGMDMLNVHMPMHIIESFAESMPFEKKYKKNFSVVYVSHPTLMGTKTRANQFENYDSGSDVSVTSFLTQMYPRVSSQSVYTFGAPGQEPSVFDSSDSTVCFFSGPGPADRRRTVGDVMLRMQGYVTVGSVMGNLHHKDYTNLYFTEILLVPPPLVQTPWSLLLTKTEVHSVANKYAFDPNAVSHKMLRILPIILVNDPSEVSAYIGITEEVVSLEVGSSYVQLKLPEMLIPVHDIAGIGTETSISDYSAIEQHKGGGFMDVLRKAGSYALPILGNIGGHLLDQVAPGMGGIVSGLGNHIGGLLGDNMTPRAAARRDMGEKVLRKSHLNPHAKVLRPLSNRRRVSGYSMPRF